MQHRRHDVHLTRFARSNKDQPNRHSSEDLIKQRYSLPPALYRSGMMPVLEWRTDDIYSLGCLEYTVESSSSDMMISLSLMMIQHVLERVLTN